MSVLNFIFGIHNHQPLGNFDFVLENSFRKTYDPFLRTLAEFPEMKVAIHYSGPLLEWLREKHPEHLDLLKDLVSKGQVELVISGFYEPVLAAIPEGDRALQIKLAKKFANSLGCNPRGLWLTERVWEPSLAATLAKCGIDYVIVDDYHFLAAGIEKKDLYGYYYTEYAGKVIAVFPIDETLRYYTPFRPVENTMCYLRSLVEEEKPWKLAVVHDDGEKYGVWPGTYEWVHQKGWLKKFFEELISAEWLRILTYSEYMHEFPGLGVVYLPTTSYFEMSEWSLPAKNAAKFVRFVSELKRRGEFNEYRIFVRGGIWKNFFLKYPESNYMHKRMLLLSSLIGKNRKARRYVLRAQCNDAYWHGIFGGLYLPHLREEIWRNLISAHDLIAKARTYERDLDIDGKLEVMFEGRNFITVFRPEYGGYMVELSSRKRKYNYCDVIARRFEHYHQVNESAAPQDGGDGIESIHELRKEIPERIRRELFYDDRLRGMFQDHFFLEEGDPMDYSAGRVKELERLYMRPYSYTIPEPRKILMEYQGEGIRIEKEINVAETITARYHVECGRKGYFGVELNFGVHGKQETPGEGEEEEFSIEDPAFGRVKVASTLPFRLVRYPVKTLSQSESGWDFIQQGVAYLMLFEVKEPLELEMEIWEERGKS